jgi:cyclomaltodextrinase
MASVADAGGRGGMMAPSWIHEAVFYQIFPDRFANGDPSLDPPNVETWGGTPTLHGFQGGDFAGVNTRLDYLADLGVNALYFNPIFLSPSNHRYNTSDYYRIDPKLGTAEDLRRLLEAAHARGMRVILDGVFNHCGRGFFAFADVLENEAESPYCDWFHILRFPLDAYGPGEAHNYQAWWRLKSLPKFNVRNPATRGYLLDVAAYWIEQGVDGWRLDVPNEISDMGFWAEFRERVKRANPEAYLVGEIWEIGPQWVGPAAFDGLINYPFREACLDLLATRTLSATGFGARVQEILGAYPARANLGHYITLGTHDVPRLRTLLRGDSALEQLAFTMMFFFPGVPGIYYGDEIGLEGEKDPDNRRAFPWEEARWDATLRRHIQRMIRLRHEHPAMREGELRVVPVEAGESYLLLVREHPQETLALLINLGARHHTIRLTRSQLGWATSRACKDELAGRTYAVGEEFAEFAISPRTALILRPLHD